MCHRYIIIVSKINNKIVQKNLGSDATKNLVNNFASRYGE